MTAPTPPPRRGQPTLPPISLSDAPTSRGMVVPYIALGHANRSYRPVWGRVDPARLAEIWDRKLCQVCGEPLNEQVIVFLRTSDVAAGVAVEPGLHPTCGDYSVQACPMLAGLIDRYNPHPENRVARCADPSCHCRVWVRPRPDPARNARPVEAWYQLCLPLDEYTVITVPATAQHPPLTGVDLRTPHLRQRIHKIRDAADPSQHNDFLDKLIAFGPLFGD